MTTIGPDACLRATLMRIHPLAIVITFLVFGIALLLLYGDTILNILLQLKVHFTTAVTLTLMALYLEFFSTVKFNIYISPILAAAIPGTISKMYIPV